MAKRKTNPKRAAPAEDGPEEKSVIARETFPWGVRVTARPLQGTENATLVITAEIRNYQGPRGSEVLITFPAASTQRPLRLLDAQAWHAALGAIIADTRAVQAEMRSAAEKKG